jgi:hypothetical protein
MQSWQTLDQQPTQTSIILLDRSTRQVKKCPWLLLRPGFGFHHQPYSMPFCRKAGKTPSKTLVFVFRRHHFRKETSSSCGERATSLEKDKPEVPSDNTSDKQMVNYFHRLIAQ